MMDKQTVFVTMGLLAWQTQIKRAEKSFNGFTDEECMQEVAPGKNRIIYLYGHLTGVHDELFEILALGPRLHPEYDDLFLQSPDRSGKEFPPVAAIRQAWSDVHGRLDAGFDRLKAEDWFGRHARVTEEAFSKEPHRNKLNVLISRAEHVAYHLGQINLVKK
jgi:hypothetical protein